jgi:predicted permease
VTPRAHPYAVLSYDYWTRRFGRDPKIIGRSFHLGNDLFRIVGIAPQTSTGTEPGTMTDIFLPTMMHAGVTHDDWGWIRTLVKLKPGGATEPTRDELQAVFNAVRRERVKSFTGWPKRRLENFLKQRIVLQPAAAGLSWMQKEYLRSLVALALLTALVLLIACANVANLLTAQAATRSRELALRVSIGAGRWRLVQLVLVESAWLASLAAACGSFFAWWAAPFVVAKINPPDNPARLVLPTDWRVLGFGLTLTVAVTILFGLAPALRASGVRSVSALKGGGDPHSRRRLMHSLIAAQAAFCFLVLFGAGLFVSTFERLTSQSTGFSPDRLLALDTVADPGQSSIVWYQTAEYLSRLPGVESAAKAAWPLFSGNGQNGFIAVNGEAPHEVPAYVLSVSPGWLDTMRIPLIDGRDFRDDDTSPGVAIVNQAFVKEYFPNDNPIGKLFAKTNWNTRHWKIIGVVGDARYRNMREPITPTVYQPFRLDAASESASEATFLVRTVNPHPLALATMFRHEVHRARSEFRVSNIRTQLEIDQSQTVRERLLAMLAFFFAIVAVMLAGIGLYGVLDYSVLQRRREIGIRMAIGAPAHDIAWRVTIDVFSMVLLGAVAGLALGMASVRYIETLLYYVKPTDLSALALPSLTILVAAALAAVPPVIRAMRIDPALSLRFE